MTFGYNADATFGQSTAEVMDHAKSLLSSLVDKREEPAEVARPLIFIAHSLGGIVVKQALFQARLESRYQSIRDTTLGLIFLGTPHRGSDKVTYGKVLATVAQSISHRPPPRLLTALQTNSDILLRLTTDFRFQLPDYHIFSFYEQRPMKGLSTLIVEKHSALLEVEHEEQIPVDADHSAICKFETDNDDTFEKVYKRVRRMRGSSRRIAFTELVSYNKHFEVPHLLSPVFTGRDADLQRLTSVFASGQPSHDRHQRRFVLFGLGGSGKTQICLKYVQEHRERYWGIFWIDASTDDLIQQGFARTARLLQVDENVDSVKRHLANTSYTWLLVLDNADDPNLPLVPYLPVGDRGDVIITSRNPGCQQYNTAGFQEIGRLSLDDSTLLLTKTIYGVTSPSQPVGKEGKMIVEALCCLALAIVQAGAYIRETSCSLNDYLEIYEKRKRLLLQYRPKHLGTDYQYSIYTTWQVSINRIQSQRDELSNHTLRLLSLLGFYHHDQIPVQMFYNAWRPSMGSQVLDYLPWQDKTSDFFDYRQAVQASISLLASFSLVTRNINATVSLHPLVHEWCRDRMSGNGHDQSYRQALSLLTGSVKLKFTTADYAFRRILVSHVHELLRLGEHQVELSEEDKMQGWPNLALVLQENGRIREALRLSEELWELNKSKLGEDHRDTLGLMNNLANRYSEAGRGPEALRLSEKVWELRKSKLGEDHPDTLSSMNNLAIRYSEAGRGPEALWLSEKVWELYKSKLGEDHPDTLQSMYNLAINYSEAGRGPEALRLSQGVLELRESRLGEDHPKTLTSMRLYTYILENTAGEPPVSAEEPPPSAEEPPESSDRHSRHRLSKLWQKFRS